MKGRIIMGLDWHSTTFATEQDKEDWVHTHCQEKLADGVPLEELIKEAPTYMQPCYLVNAPKMKSRTSFDDFVLKEIEDHREEAIRISQQEHYNHAYVEYWKNATLESVKKDMGDKFDCENCPLLKALQGADSSESPFLGVTVKSCDFRGKVISSDGVINEQLQNMAFEDMDPNRMLEYADLLEEELERLRKDGFLNKDSYGQYCREYDEDDWPLKDAKLSKEQYEKSMHWREENIRRAIHWLRVCSELGIHKYASY